MKVDTRVVRLRAFGGPEVLEIVRRPLGPPCDDELLVEVEVAGTNFGDTMIRRGEYLRNQPLSMGPGCEAVGRVVAAGHAHRHRVGERVAAWVEEGSAYADHVLVPAHRAYTVREDVPAGAVAAVFLQGLTADYALHRFGRLAAGESVLVHGAAGGVGVLTCALAAAAGAHVVATASSPAKREAALRAGAAVALDSRDTDGLTTGIRENTDGRGCDVVVDGVGGPLFGPSLAALAVNGRYVIVGSASQSPASLDARRLLVRNQTVVGFVLAHITATDPAEPQATLDRLCAAVADDSLRPVVEVRTLEHAVDVHHDLDGRRVVGKIVLSAAGADPGPEHGELS